MFKIIDEESEISDIKNQIEKWQRYDDNKMNNLFATFFSDHQGNSGYPMQWSRITGLKYGNPITPIVASNILSATRIWMHLGIYEEVIDDESFDRFNIIFETENAQGQKKFISNAVDNTFNYSIKGHEIPANTSRRFGISTELRNQLTFDWLSTFLPLYYPFYALIPHKDELPIFEFYPKIGNTCWVKAHSYIIEGNNLTALKEILIESNTDCKINIAFGLSPTNYFIDKDLFSIIVEIESSHQSGTEMTYLDFVGACPPACSGDGNT